MILKVQYYTEPLCDLCASVARLLKENANNANNANGRDVCGCVIEACGVDLREIEVIRL